MAETTEAPASPGYKLLLTGDGISIDRELDTPTALAVVELVMGGPAAESAARPASGSTGTKRRRKIPRSKEGSAPRKARRRSGSPSIVRDLSLRPKGKQAFMEFVEEKRPRNHFERQAVVVYWLAKVAGMHEGITVDHINTCYVTAKWKRPAQFEGNLQLTAARRGWIDTSDGSSIQITVAGEDYVVHDLPATAD